LGFRLGFGVLGFGPVGHGALLGWYRGTSLIRKCHPLGPYSRTMLRALWWS